MSRRRATDADVMRGAEYYRQLIERQNRASQAIPLSTTCYVKKMVTGVATGALMLLWTVVIVMGSWMGFFFFENPIKAVAAAALAFAVLTATYLVHSKNRRRRMLETEVVNFRNRVYAELSTAAGQPVMAKFVCHRIVWHDYPNSRCARDRASRVIFPMVVRNLDADARIHKSWTLSNGTPELVWQWLDRAYPPNGGQPPVVRLGPPRT